VFGENWLVSVGRGKMVEGEENVIVECGEEVVDGRKE
jgi:hypothetical protein